LTNGGIFHGFFWFLFKLLLLRRPFLLILSNPQGGIWFALFFVEPGQPIRPFPPAIFDLPVSPPLDL